MKLSTTTQSPHYLTMISAIYAFLFLLPSLLLRKMILVPGLGIIPISILFTGTYFMLLDIVTEVYGFHQAKKLMIAGLVTYTLFVFIMMFINHIPSPQHFHIMWNKVQDPDAYRYLFHDIDSVWVAVVICTLLANTINIYILSKSKILTKGKYFWLRSVGTSLISAIIFSSVSNLFAFGFFLKISQIPYYFELTAISIFAKLATLIVFAYPSTLVCYYLKRKENLDVYDYNLSFNPFKKSS